MYALVETSGTQHRVQEGDEIVVDRVDAQTGESFELSRVLLISGDQVTVGKPYIDGASVQAEVVKHFLGDKVETYKYRRARRYRNSVGFRARLSLIKIQSINA